MQQGRTLARRRDARRRPLSDSVVEPLATPWISKRDVIRRIAEAIGQPEAVFYDAAGCTSAIAEQAELLRIWDGLTDPADRRKVLTFAQAVASGRSQALP